MKYDDAVAGKLCLAKHADGNWYRGYIKQKCFNNDTWDFEVFFLDYGDSCTVQLQHLRVLSKQFSERLPFQAIACSLNGLGSTSGADWTEQNVDYFLSLTRDQDKILHQLTVKCALKEAVKDEMTLGPRYMIDLVHQQKCGTVNLADLMMAHKLGGEPPKLVQDVELVEKVNDLDLSIDEEECEVSSQWLDLFRPDQTDPSAASGEKNEEQAETCAPLVDELYPKKSTSSCFPTTKWAQNEQDVTVTFLLGEVVHYEVRLSDNHLCFESNHNGKKYGNFRVFLIDPFLID